MPYPITQEPTDNSEIQNQYNDQEMKFVGNSGPTQIESGKYANLEVPLAGQNNIIMASVSEAQICKCEPHECQMSTGCCSDCPGEAQICSTNVPYQ